MNKKRKIRSRINTQPPSIWEKPASEGIQQSDFIIKSLIKKYDSIYQAKESIIATIISIIESHSPMHLLQRAYWEFYHSLSSEGVFQRQVLEYIQAAIVSIRPLQNQESDISEENWKTLTEAIEKLYGMSQLYIFKLCQSKDQTNLEKPDNLLTQAILNWLNVRGERYAYHTREHIYDALRLQNDILVSAFGVTANEIASACNCMSLSLRLRLHQSIHEYQQIKNAPFTEDEFDSLSHAIPENATDEESTEILAEAFDKKVEVLQEKLTGYHLFDVRKNTHLPEQFLSHFSLEPGELNDAAGLFDSGELSGLPLKLFPTWNKPFLNYKGEYYLFDINLLDRMHYYIGKEIRKVCPSDKEKWNENQKEMSESVPVNLFQKLLRGGKALRSIYYQWHDEKDPSKVKWYETDCIISYGDWLFVIEVKAGSHTYTSPADQFSAHISSLRELLIKPTEQGKRFVDYLNSKESVGIFNQQHVLIENISYASFSRTVLCSITWEQLTQHASTIQFEQRYSPSSNSHPVLCISVDDLRVMADLFSTPVEFLHYIQERLRAYAHPSLQLIYNIDECDHLGLYFEYNDYSKYLSEYKASKIIITEFDNKINQHFEKLFLGIPSTFIGQKYPPIIRSTLDILGSKKDPRATTAAITLLDMDGKSRKLFADAVQTEILRQTQGDDPKHCTVMPLPISFSCSKQFTLSKRFELRDLAAETAILRAGDSQYLFLLIIDGNFAIKDIIVEVIILKEFSETKKHELYHNAAQLAQSRLSKSGKVGRNDKCPCGSGDKFKKCCGVI